jgi:ATP synthase protein I
MKPASKSKIFNVLYLQLLLGSIVAVAVALFANPYVVSAICGVTIALLSTGVYSYFTFRYGVVATPKTALRRHQVAMLIRFVVNAVGFLVVLLLYPHVNFIAMIITYCITLSGYWFSLLL